MSQWKGFFEAHAPHYDQNPFTQFTEAEVEFILKLYPLSPGATILDVGCGTGRHAVALAKRGFDVTGLDLTPGMLTIARQRAVAAGVSVQWIEADAKDFRDIGRFDAAICLCEGGVGLIEATEDAESHDAAIFRNISACLQPNAPFVLTALNGYSVIRQMKDEHIKEGAFDPMSMYSVYADEWELPEGLTHVNIRERLFIPPEVIRMLKEAGFVVDNVYGGTAGHWAQRFLSLDEVEAMYIARKAP